MPQLDTNTFIGQYISLIILVFVIYTLLAYGILPLLLRAIIIRSQVNPNVNENVSQNSVCFQRTRIGLLNQFSGCLLNINKIYLKRVKTVACGLTNILGRSTQVAEGGATISVILPGFTSYSYSVLGSAALNNDT